MTTIYNSSYNDNTGYVFNDDGSVKVIMKATGKEVEGVTFDEQKVLEDAAKACIKNDIYVPEVKTEAVKKPAPGYDCDLEPEKEEVRTCYVEDVKKVEAEIAKEVADQPIEVPDDIKHHLNAKDFGEYRIVISEYDDRDEIPFVGTKEELNKFIANLHLHVVPKVYKMIQLKVETKYEVL